MCADDSPKSANASSLLEAIDEPLFADLLSAWAHAPQVVKTNCDSRRIPRVGVRASPGFICRDIYFMGLLWQAFFWQSWREPISRKMVATRCGL